MRVSERLKFHSLVLNKGVGNPGMYVHTCSYKLCCWWDSFSTSLTMCDAAPVFIPTPQVDCIRAYHFGPRFIVEMEVRVRPFVELGFLALHAGVLTDYLELADTRSTVLASATISCPCVLSCVCAV